MRIGDTKPGDWVRLEGVGWARVCWHSPRLPIVYVDAGVPYERPGFASDTPVAEHRPHRQRKLADGGAAVDPLTGR